MAALIVIAQTTSAGGADWADIVERLGAAAVVAVLAVLALRRVYNEKSALEASVREEVIPALVRATDVLERALRRLDER